MLFIFRPAEPLMVAVACSSLRAFKGSVVFESTLSPALSFLIASRSSPYPVPQEGRQFVLFTPLCPSVCTPLGTVKGKARFDSVVKSICHVFSSETSKSSCCLSLTCITPRWPRFTPILPHPKSHSVILDQIKGLFFLPKSKALGDSVKTLASSLLWLETIPNP